MEFLILIIGGIWFIIWIVGLFSGVGDGGYSGYDNNLGDFRGRAIETSCSLDSGDDVDVIQFEGRGILDHRYDREELTVAVNMIDVTEEGDISPVLTTMDWQQEEETMILLNETELGPMEMDVGFSEWASMGIAPIDTTLFPKKGMRKFAVCFYLYPTHSNARIQFGVLENPDLLYGFHEAMFNLVVKEDGYVERGENINKARKLAIQLAMCMSAADGSIDQPELDTIKLWVEKISTMESEEDREGFVSEFSQLINSASQDALSGLLSLDDTINGINQYAQDTEKYEAIELILDVMTSDGVADQSELTMLDKVTTRLSLDPGQVRALRDKRISSAGSVQLEKGDLRLLVGISEDMTEEEVRRLWAFRWPLLSEGPPKSHRFMSVLCSTNGI